MGVGICDKHNYCTFIISCEHINNVVEKMDEIKNLDYVTVVEYKHTKFLGFSDKYAYCDKCAEKYWLPRGNISQIRLLFSLPFRKKFTTENEFYVCDQCFFEDLFDQTFIDYINNPKFKYPFMNKTEKVIEAKVPKFQIIKEIEESTQVATYAKMNISVERGKGSWIWTSEGEKFLDLYGGHAVCGTGHSHPAVVEAIKEQADKVLFYSNLVYSEIRAKVSEKLVSVAPDNITKAFFCNSGTEANENAMRMARFATGREKIITFTGGFHGRSADSISATFLGKYREIGKPNVPGHVCAEFGNLDSVRELADDQTAAIMLEPIQSMFGCREATPEFFQGLRQICDEHGIILIFDEVQTGVGRTGNWFFSGSENAGGVQADVITLAKSLGSGIPVGACLVNEKVSKNIKTNDLGTTFGGGMLAMAAVLATLEAIENEDMIANAKRIENHLRERLKEVEEVVAVHGKGCLIGIEFSSPAKDYHAKLLEHQIITGTSSVPNVLRLLPPLCVKEEEIDLLVEVLKS